MHCTFCVFTKPDEQRYNREAYTDDVEMVDAEPYEEEEEEEAQTAQEEFEEELYSEEEQSESDFTRYASHQRTAKVADPFHSHHS